MITDNLGVPEVLHSNKDQAKPEEQNLGSIEPVPLKRKQPGKYWFYLSGVHPDNGPELRIDVDPHAPSSGRIKVKLVMKYSETKSFPVYTGKLVTVVNLLLLGYNNDDSRLYFEAGLAFGAQINSTLMPAEPDIQTVKLRRLHDCLAQKDFEKIKEWCLHEYPRTMEYLCGRNFYVFFRGLIRAHERRWIHVPRVRPVIYRVEVE